jgi:cysteine desulfurase/selenocysteine lyase
VRGTTEGINLIAKTWGAQNVGEGDEIIVSHLEHHANIVPWQQLAAAKGAKIKVIPVDDSGQVLLDEYRKLLTSRTKIVSVTQVSNALGTVVPVKEIVAEAHRFGAVAVVDGAQSVSHMRVCRTSTRTSSCSRATRSSAPPASAWCMASGTSSRPCPRGRAAAT